MKDVNKIIEEYRNNAVLHWNASREGDYKTANKSYAKLSQIYKLLIQSEELSKNVLLNLLNDQNYAVQLWAASHCLALENSKEGAVLKLELISKMSSNEAPSFEAKMILNEWREKGKLTL